MGRKKSKRSNTKAVSRGIAEQKRETMGSENIVSSTERYMISNSIPADKKNISDLLSRGEWYLKSSKGSNNTFERRVIMEDGTIKRQTTSLSKTPSTKNAYKDQKKQLLRDEYWMGVSHIVIAVVAQAF